MFQLPASSSTLPVNWRADARLRTMLMAAPGSPAPLTRPVAPRTTSTRSNIARLVKISPLLQGCSQVVGVPSIISVLTSKPRETNWARLASYWCTDRPVVLATASVTVRMPWSSMRCVVMTEIDCGVSRGDRFSGVAVRAASTV